MTTYKEIFGKPLKFVSSDLSNDAAIGEIWYNSTTGKFKSIVAGGAWSSSSNALVARDTAASTGPQTSALVFGGATPSRTTATEEYNGFGWSTGGVLPTATTGMGSARNASQTAALGMGGYDGAKTGATFKYDGTSWTAAGTMGTPRQLYMVGGGTQTAAITFGGDTYPPAPSRNTTATEEYDGSSWTAANSLGTGGYSGAGTGPQSAAVRMGAPSTSNNTVTENFDGTNWTASGTIPISKSAMLAAGTQTASILFGGIPAPLSTTALEYDGSTYSAIPSPAIIKYNNAGGGSSSAAFMSHGRTPAPAFVTTTEQYNFTANTVTAGAWSSGTAFPSVRWNTSGTGIATASLTFGGSTGPALPTFLNTTFEGDGSSWTSAPTTPISSINMFSAGIQTASIGGGGLASPGSNSDAAFTYNGSSWTNITATPFATKGAGAAGTSTAALIIGSDVPGPNNQDSYSWNGSSWSEEGALNDTFQNGAAGGPTENTAFVAGSEYSPAPSTRFETYNGSAWTSGPNMTSAQYQNRGFGSSTEAMSIGGYDKITTVQRFNGTAWATSPSLAVGRKQFASSNFSASGITNGWVGGGADGPSAVEEFTDETTVLNVKTLTTS